jgi:hypothetical protein
MVHSQPASKQCSTSCEHSIMKSYSILPNAKSRQCVRKTSKVSTEIASKKIKLKTMLILLSGSYWLIEKDAILT